MGQVVLARKMAKVGKEEIVLELEAFMSFFARERQTTLGEGDVSVGVREARFIVLRVSFIRRSRLCFCIFSR